MDTTPRPAASWLIALLHVGIVFLLGLLVAFLLSFAIIPLISLTRLDPGALPYFFTAVALISILLGSILSALVLRRLFRSFDAGKVALFAAGYYLVVTVCIIGFRFFSGIDGPAAGFTALATAVTGLLGAALLYGGTRLFSKPNPNR